MTTLLMVIGGIRVFVAQTNLDFFEAEEPGQRNTHKSLLARTSEGSMKNKGNREDLLLPAAGDSSVTGGRGGGMMYGPRYLCVCAYMCTCLRV